MGIRNTKLILQSKPTLEGEGVHLKRAFGYHEVPQFDPFLMMDDFRNDDPQKYQRGFPFPKSLQITAPGSGSCFSRANRSTSRSPGAAPS